MDVDLDVDVVGLTRRLVDIESTSGHEAALGDFLVRELSQLGWEARPMPVAAERFNVYAAVPGRQPTIVFSTHMDTVPPFIASREDEQRIYGRGACDAKGIIAAQVAAAGRLRADGLAVGLLFVVGEERDSLGAAVANQHSPGPRFLINGEPTENRIAMASKGALRVEITARGVAAHSAYPELGHSAIDELLDALARIRALELPADPVAGSCTMNIGLIEGGRAPNVVADFARAHLLYRLIGPSDELRRRIMLAAGERVQVEFVLEIPFVRLRSLDGLPTMTAAFTTDIPRLSNWGEPLLIGPGSIHVAHTEGECVEKQQLRDAVELYCKIAHRLLTS